MTAPTVNLYLEIQQGLGFEFVKEFVILRCSLLNDIIKTDPINPSNTSDFVSKLIWKIDKDTYQKLTIHDIPIRIDVLTAKKKRLIGYLNLSLLTARICSADEKVKIKCTWNKLLGIKYIGRSSNPRLLLNLILEDISHPELNSKEKISNTEEITDFFNGTNKDPNMDEIRTINIGEESECNETFELSFNIAKYENLNLLHNSKKMDYNSDTFYFNLSVFSKMVRLGLNHKESFIIHSTMLMLSDYLKNNPYSIIRYCNARDDIGLSCFDLRKMVPTTNTSDFLIDFCDSSEAFSLKEKCYIIDNFTGDIPIDSNGNKPFIMVEVILKFLNRIETPKKKSKNLDDKIEGVIRDTADCAIISPKHTTNVSNIKTSKIECSEFIPNPSPENNNTKIDMNLSPRSKEMNILQIVNELEDWKEYQQEIFKANLKQKETNFLEALHVEWQSKRNDHESELIQNIEYCHNLIRSLNEIIDNLKIRETQLENKEKNLLNAKNEIKMEYKMKYQEIMDASNKMQFDCEHQLQLHKVKYTQMVNEVRSLSQENARLKDSLQIVDTIKNEIFND